MGKFKIPSVPPTINKTVRFPTDVVEQVEKAIQGKDCTFSAFVIAAVRMALENIDEKQGRFTCRLQNPRCITDCSAPSQRELSF